MGEQLARFFEWYFAALADLLAPVTGGLTACFAWAIAQLQGLVPFANGFGDLVFLLLFIGAPAFIAYGISRLVSRTTERSMGRTDALMTTGAFAVAAGCGLGSILGVTASFGGIAFVLVAIWTFLTAAGFLFGSRSALGTMPAVVIAGLIPPLAVLSGLTVYAV